MSTIIITTIIKSSCVKSLVRNHGRQRGIEGSVDRCVQDQIRIGLQESTKLKASARADGEDQTFSNHTDTLANILRSACKYLKLAL